VRRPLWRARPLTSSLRNCRRPLEILAVEDRVQPLAQAPAPHGLQPPLAANATLPPGFGPEARHFSWRCNHLSRVLVQDDAPLPIGRPSPERERGAGAGGGGTAAASTAGLLQAFRHLGDFVNGCIDLFTRSANFFLSCSSPFFISRTALFCLAFSLDRSFVLFRFVTLGGQSPGCRPFSNSRHPIYNDIPAARQKYHHIQHVKPFFSKRRHTYNVPDLADMISFL